MHATNQIDTLPKLLKSRYEAYPNHSAMRKKDYGIWRNYTWIDYYINVKYLALGLISLGLKPKDRVGILGDGDPEWYWAELAIQSTGAISVGIFSDSGIPEVKYIVEHSGARFVFARDQEQIDKMLALRIECPQVEKIIYWDAKGLWSYDEPSIIGFQEMMDLGREYEQLHTGLLEEIMREVKGEDVAAMCYTSGTGGLPKGALLSHKNIITSARLWHENIAPADEHCSSMAGISPAWYGEQCLGIGSGLVTGMVMTFPENTDTLQANSREIGPHIITNPPRIWEGLASMTQAKIMDADFLKRLFYRLLLPIGYKIAELSYAGRHVSPFWKVLYKLGDWTVFRPLKDKLGLLMLSFGLTSGAALNPDTFRFFRALGVELRQGYALTEVGFIAAHRENDVQFETTGPPLHGGPEVRITDAGEITCRGDTVLFGGYYEDHLSTEKAIKDKWLHTGDAGYIDEEGQVVYSDRLTDMMELAGGNKFPPTFIEGRLKFSPYIKDAMAIGGKDKPYVSAVVSIDLDNVGRWAEKSRVQYTTYADLSQKPEVHILIRKDIERINRFLPEVARVKRFINMYKEFDADEAELTRTRKLRRNYMEERYKNMLDGLYGDRAEMVVETEVRYRDGRIGVAKIPVRVVSLGE